VAGSEQPENQGKKGGRAIVKRRGGGIIGRRGMAESIRDGQERALLDWLLGRRDLSETQVLEILKRWRESPEGVARRPLASILIECGQITPDRLSHLMAVSLPGGGGTAPAPVTPTVRMPAPAREALKSPERWFGPTLEHGLPKYLLTRSLGAGGMGEVYQGYQVDLDRWVALKFPKVADEVDRARFMREARLAGGLSHPNIVAVYEVGESEGRAFIAMEFIDGIDLFRLRVEPRRACELVRDAARGLAYAHERGVIHRDVKPQNFLLSRSGRLAVTDFGLARTIREDGASAALTRSGEIMGTPSYMAPESARGSVREIDRRSDVYGLGATLYYLLTGRAPFDGEGIWEIVEAVLERDPVAPRRIDRRIDRDAELIVLKCLEKEQARRYDGATELADDLDRYLRGEPIRARAPSLAYRIRKRIRRHPLLSAAAALIVVLSGVAAGFGVRSWIKAREADVAARERDVERACSTVDSIISTSMLMGGPLDMELYPPYERPNSRAFQGPSESSMIQEAVEKAFRKPMVSPSARYEVLYSRAMVHLVFGELEEALATFDRAEQQGMAFFQRDTFHIYRGLARERAGDVEGALEDFSRVEEKTTFYKIPALTHTATLMELSGRAAEARRQFDAAAGLVAERGSARHQILDRLARGLIPDDGRF
jgi:tetratricopeptide (TPR) repeat protein